MIETEPEEIKYIRDYQKKLITKPRVIIVAILFLLGLSIGLTKRTSLTLLRIKCIEIAGFGTSNSKYDSVLITKSMIINALDNTPIDKNKFAQGYIPYLIGKHYPLFTTNYSIKQPLFFTNLFTKGDIGFLKLDNKSDTVSIDIYRYSFDYLSLGKESIKISLSQLDTTEKFEIKYIPEQFIIINNLDSIKLYSVDESNKMIIDYIDKTKSQQ